MWHDQNIYAFHDQVVQYKKKLPFPARINLRLLNKPHATLGASLSFYNIKAVLEHSGTNRMTRKFWGIILGLLASSLSM